MNTSDANLIRKNSIKNRIDCIRNANVLNRNAEDSFRNRRSAATGATGWDVSIIHPRNSVTSDTAKVFEAAAD